MELQGTGIFPDLRVRNWTPGRRLPLRMSPALLQRIEEFKQRAERCEQYAREASDELMREQFVTTADNWRKLAAEAERMLGRMSGSDST
jgi:hypothetical protein